MTIKGRLLYPPSFLICSERSGSTLLGLMLGHHPQLCWVGEFEYAFEHLPDDRFLSADELAGYLSEDRVYENSGFNLHAHLSYPQRVTTWLEDKRNLSAKHFVGATVHKGIHHIPRLFTDARYVVLQRDGRDVANSCIGMGWAGNLWAGADRWIKAQHEIALLRQRVDPDSVLVIRFEELLAQPEQTLTKIITHISPELSIKDAALKTMLSYPVTSSYSAPKAQKSERWRQLSQKDVSLAEEKLGPWLEKAGYNLSGYEIRTITPLKVWILKIEDRLKRITFRLKRYGWSLVAIGALSRRFRFDALAHRIQLNMNKIDERYLK